MAETPFSEFYKAFTDFKMPQMPQMDFNNAFSIQRRNMEAFSAANQVVTESMQAISRRQSEIFRSSVEDYLKAMKDMFSSTSPEQNASKQAELTKSMFESSLNNLRELAEMVSKSNIEAFDVVNKRMIESMEEVRRTASGAK